MAVTSQISSVQTRVVERAADRVIHVACVIPDSDDARDAIGSHDDADLTHPIGSLPSPAASFTTGQDLVVNDGGRTAW